MTPQAQQIVDRFRQILFDGKLYTAQFDNPALKADTEKCIQCAIVAVEMVLEATKETIDRPEYSGVVYDAQWRYILTELKKELK